MAVAEIVGKANPKKGGGDNIGQRKRGYPEGEEERKKKRKEREEKRGEFGWRGLVGKMHSLAGCLR